MSEFFDVLNLQFGREFADPVDVECDGVADFLGLQSEAFAGVTILAPAANEIEIDLTAVLAAFKPGVRIQNVLLRIGDFTLWGDPAADDNWSIIQSGVLAGVGTFANGGNLITGNVINIKGAAGILLGLQEQGASGDVIFYGQPIVGTPLVLECPGSCRVGVFADDNQGDTPPAIPGILDRTEKQLAVAGGRVDLGVELGGQPLILTDVGQAYPRADNTYFIRASDVGVQPGQIPPTIAANVSSALRLQPSVFVRETSDIRGLKGDAVTTENPDPITVAGGAPTLLDVVRAPTHSRWILEIDSSRIEVVVAHPAGSDLRRPKEVWQAVWRGLLASTNAKGSGTANGLQHFSTFITSAGGGSRLFFSRGLIRGLRYLQCATFVEPLDSSLVSITTPIVQA